MAVTWMWGWELGTTELTYTNTGWVVGGISNQRVVADTNPYQPAAGYGGGRFNFRGGSQTFGNAGRIRTPISGFNSIGTWQRFIFSTCYMRYGNTGNNGSGNQYGSFLRFYTGSSYVVELTHVNSQVSTSPFGLRVNDNLIATTTTTYTATQPYHRIVLDIDGATGSFDVYVNGVLEISTGPTIYTFTSIDGVEFLPGSDANATSPTAGGSHDHSVLFDAGNRATGDLILANLPNNNETVSIGAVTYTFKTVLTPAANEVLIGASAAEARRNLTHAINLGPGSGTWYAATTPLNPTVTAEIDASLPGMHVYTKVSGNDVSVLASTLTGGGDGWTMGALMGGDLDPTNDLALALGQIFIQGLQPNSDVTPGSWDTQPLSGQPLYSYVNDGQNLTDFIETTVSPDAHVLGMENRSDIDPAWAPSQVHAVQTVQIARASGAITEGRTTVEVPSKGTTTSDANPLTASGKMVNTLRRWRDANITTDVDGLETGFEV